jgi:DNA polymerase-3 subunit epsilon
VNVLKPILWNRWLRFRLARRNLRPAGRANLSALDGLDLSAPARDQRYVVLDLETTGLDPEKDRVVSIGALRVVDGRVRLGDVFSELVNPGRDIPTESIKVHGIMPGQIEEARLAWEVFEDFLGFIGRDILVAHYACFDLYFLNKVMRAQYGFRMQNLVLDTVLMCRTALIQPDPYGVRLGAQRCGLDALIERYRLHVPDRHTALGDALATAFVFQRLLMDLERAGWTTVRDLLKVAGEW